MRKRLCFFYIVLGVSFPLTFVQTCTDTAVVGNSSGTISLNGTIKNYAAMNRSHATVPDKLLAVKMVDGKLPIVDCNNDITVSDIDANGMFTCVLVVSDEYEWVLLLIDSKSMGKIGGATGYAATAPRNNAFKNALVRFPGDETKKDAPPGEAAFSPSSKTAIGRHPHDTGLPKHRLMATAQSGGIFGFLKNGYADTGARPEQKMHLRLYASWDFKDAGFNKNAFFSSSLAPLQCGCNPSRTYFGFYVNASDKKILDLAAIDVPSGPSGTE